MSVRHQIPYKSGIFYITITCARWIPLFEKYNLYSVVYDWFNYLKSQGHYINAYVIMPNHLHAIISFSHTEKSINKIVGDGKRFMSYAIIQKLKELQEAEQLRNKKHEVFEPSFDWKLLESDNFFEQKLSYIHTNPVRTNIPIVKDPIEYIHSSALQYFNGNHYLYEIKLIHEMKDINLTISKYGIE
jgi:REP element-mobilizing transposase RayT